MDELFELVSSRVSEVLPRVRSLRHAIHSEPEVGLDTPITAAKVRAALELTSVGLWQPLMSTDVVGELRGPSRTICLRADMDANGMQEAGELPYRSVHHGAMHACGHDGHAAMLVGAALVLDSLKHRLSVGVRFVFQPGEEALCGGKELVGRGACDGCEAAFALHGWPGVPLGAVSAREGPMMAAGTHFRITVTGRGCHGSMPENGANPIPTAARVVGMLHELHRGVSEADGSVVSVCMLNAGTFSNVIPDSAVVEGTARFLSAERGCQITGSIDGIVAAQDGIRGCRCEVSHDGAYDLPVLNTSRGYELVRTVAEYCLPGGFVELQRPSMAMEDFAFYIRHREGAMFFLGLGEDSPQLHSSAFDFSDNALAHGITMLSMLALRYR